MLLVCAHSKVVYNTGILEWPYMVNNVGLAKYSFVNKVESYASFDMIVKVYAYQCWKKGPR